jgi:hypothetical protein
MKYISSCHRNLYEGDKGVIQVEIVECGIYRRNVRLIQDKDSYGVHIIDNILLEMTSVGLYLFSFLHHNHIL